MIRTLTRSYEYTDELTITPRLILSVLQTPQGCDHYPDRPIFYSISLLLVIPSITGPGFSVIEDGPPQGRPFKILGQLVRKGRFVICELFESTP